MFMIQRIRTRRESEAGFTLIELIVTVSIVSIIMVALTGMVMMYMKTTVSTAARLTESHDIQLAAAYWQRDVASVGVRSTVYDSSVGGSHTYPLVQSIAAPDTGSPALANCTLPAGTPVITLAWNTYGSAGDDPTRVSVTYVAQESGAGYDLVRVRCSGTTATPDSVIPIAGDLTSAIIAPSAISCLKSDGVTATPCSGAALEVPAVVKMELVSKDLDNNDGSTYTVTLTGERRQT